MSMHHRHRIIILLVVLMLAQPRTVFALSSTQDTDGDGIPDIQEDTDGNGIVDTGETNPMKADTDGGGESDGAEVAGKRNPLDPTDDMTYDRDGDGWANGIELLHDTDPTIADTDGDGVSDPQDAFPTNKKYSIDADANGLPDVWEAETTLATNQVPQTKASDPDNDTLTNAEELARGTDPTKADTDGDGVNDSAEIKSGQNPRENACLAYQPAPNIFTDMTNHWAIDVVENLANLHQIQSGNPIVKGYSIATKKGQDIQFKPDQSVTRFEFLKMVLASTCRKLSPFPDPDVQEFSDIPKQTQENESPDMMFRRQVIYSAAQDRVVQGYPDYSFRPNAPVTRAEAVKILSLAVKGWSGDVLDDENGKMAFIDTNSEEWYWPFLSLSVKRELVSGYPDSTFRPSEPITRAESAKIIERSIRQNPFINGYVLPEAK